MWPVQTSRQDQTQDSHSLLEGWFYMTTLLATACGARPPRKKPGTPDIEDLIPRLASELLEEAGCCHKAQVCVCTGGLPRQLRSTWQTCARFLFFSVPHKPLGVKESNGQQSSLSLLSSRKECRRGVRGIGNPLRRGWATAGPSQETLSCPLAEA